MGFPRHILLLPFVVAASSCALASGAASYCTCAEIAAAIERFDTRETPFCVTGQIVLVNHTPISSEISVCDRSGSVILWGSPKARPVLGNTVAVSGLVHPDLDILARANYDAIADLGAQPLPAPLPASAHDIISGTHDWKRIRTRGILQDVFPSEFTHDWVLMTLNCEGITIHASTPRTGGLFKKLSAMSDAVIDLTGIPLPQDGSKRTRLGRILHYSGLRDISVVAPPPADPFDVPSVSAIKNLSPSVVSTLGRHSVRGQVLAIWDEVNALLCTESGEYCKVSFKGSPRIHVHDFVTAVGYPESDLQHINMISAMARPSPAFSRTNAPPVDLERILTKNKDSLFQVAKRHGHLVRLAGTVRTKPSPGNPNKVFYADIGNYLIPVNFSSVPEILPLLELESRIEVTGPCVLDIENWRPRQTFPRVNGFFIVLRTPKDLRVLSRPPWWTPRRLTTVIGTLLAVLVSILFWNLTLRRLAARKGRELFREQLGHVKADLRTEERTRLAVELHDTLAQNLTGVSMEIEAASDLRGNAPQAMLDHLGIAAKALKSCRDELRNCLWDLRSQALEEKDMTKAILRTLQPYVNDSRLVVRFNVPRARLSDNSAHILLCVIRELVVNAIRHGNAPSVKVAGALSPGKLLCSVTDNGCGFDPAFAPGVLQGHFGLQGVRERIDEIGGTFTLSSAPGGGTRAVIALTVPTGASDANGIGTQDGNEKDYSPDR